MSNENPGMNWGIPLLNINKLWNFTRGEGIHIAVLDTGIDLNNTDLKDSVVDKWNFVSNSLDVQDIDGHGTNCSGIIAARGKNKVLGVAPGSSLLVAKIMDDAYGSGFKIENLVNAVQWAANKNASIISMSLELDQDFPQVKKIIEDVYRDSKIIFVAAVGNAGQLNKEVNVFPACYPECISIGAMDNTMTRYKTSNLSKHLSLLAPGVNLLTTSLNNETKYCTDSSFATAFTSGTFALIAGYLARKNITMDKKDFIKGFINTATHYGTVTGRDLESGYGIINPDGFVSKIKKDENEN